MSKPGLIRSVAIVVVAVLVVAAFHLSTGVGVGEWWPQALGVAVGLLLGDLVRYGLAKRRVSGR